jgi:undecaprenyl pyrophosphate phosphatase UppP
VPVIPGAALLESRHITSGVAAVGAVPLAVSFVIAFVAGLWSIRFLVALLKQGRFYRFAPYNWAIGLLTIAYGLWRG